MQVRSSGPEAGRAVVVREHHCCPRGVMGRLASFFLAAGCSIVGLRELLRIIMGPRAPGQDRQVRHGTLGDLGDCR